MAWIRFAYRDTEVNRGILIGAIVITFLLLHWPICLIHSQVPSAENKLPKVELSSHTYPAELVSHLYLIADSLQLMTKNDVHTGVHDNSFSRQRFDNSTALYWGLFSIKFDSVGLYYFSVANAFDSLEAFVVKEYGVNSNDTGRYSYTGYDVPISKRSVPKAYAQAVLPIDIEAPGVYKVYLRLKTRDPILRNLRNLEKPQFYSKYSFEEFIYDAYLIGGIYIGIAVLAFFINLVWYLENKKRLNFLFMCFLLCGFIYKISASGYITEWFYQDTPIITAYLRQIFPILVTTFYVLFCLQYIHSKTRFPRSHKIIHILLLIYILSSPIVHYIAQFWSVPTFIIGMLGNLLVAYLSIVVILSFIEFRKEGVTQQSFFTLGVLIYFVGIIAFYIHYVLQLYPGSYFFKFYFSIVSSVREVFLFLGTAYGFIRSERLLAIENEVNKRITKQKEELAILNSTNQKILSLVTHDLRNPLFNLECLLDMFKNKELSEEEFKKLVSEVEGAVENTTGLFENVLLWAKGQQVSLTPKIEPLHLEDIIEETRALMTPIAENKAIRLSITYPSNVQIRGDHEMLKSVLRNLISNAIKFSDINSTIEVSVEKTENMVVFIVQDQGIGMTQEDVTHLFNIDKKSKKGTKNESGTGLGLVLAQEFLEKHGSSLKADSVLNEGSKFSFSLEA